MGKEQRAVCGGGLIVEVGGGEGGASAQQDRTDGLTSLLGQVGTGREK